MVQSHGASQSCSLDSHPESESKSWHHLHLFISWQHYMKEQGAICTKLVKPKPKSGMKSAEEELAKGRGWWEGIVVCILGTRPHWRPLLTCPCAHAQLAGC